MNIVFLGTGSFGVPALEAVLRAGHRVLRCISQPDRPAGRGRQIQPTPVHAAADALGIPHIQTGDINALPTAELTAGAELGLVAAFGQKINPAFLDAVPRGCINIHGSLLPRYRGAAPYQWAIINGDAETGVTVFQLNERWDAGAIWSIGRIPIGETQTADELHDALGVLGASVILEALERISRGDQPLPQDATQATRAPKLSKNDSAIDWSQPAVRIARRIHGLWSWPAASSTYVAASGRHEPLQIARARVVSSGGATADHANEKGAATNPAPTTPAGTFLADLSVKCGEGALKLLEVKPAGGKLMTFEAFANGRRVAPGDRLLPPEPRA